MPYIEIKDRPKFELCVDTLATLIKNKGELNYVISELVGRWIVENKLFSYTGISNAISAVHDAELELNRRILVPYESGKILENEDLESFQNILDALKIITGRDENLKKKVGDVIDDA